MKRSFLIPLILVLVIAIPVVAGAVATWLLRSNITETSLEYVAVASSSLLGSTITITVTVTKSGVPIQNALVYLYRCTAVGVHNSGPNSTALDAINTNVSGVATFTDAATTNGKYYHIAEWYVP